MKIVLTQIKPYFCFVSRIIGHILMLTAFMSLNRNHGTLITHTKYTKYSRRFIKLSLMEL